MSDSLWQKLKYDERYEINTEYPYSIRKIGELKNISEWIASHGYYMCSIGGNGVLKHRLIALQFIENDDPENKTQIDHIDRNKFNNSIINLRWCTAVENANNKNQMKRQKDVFLKELPDDAERINVYNDYEFDRYYYDIWNEKILLQTMSGKVKVINPYIDGYRSRVTLYDLNLVRRKFDYNRLIEYLRNLY